ncbi:ATPase [soil metagenome]
MKSPRVLVSWSAGKDSAWMLYVLRRRKSSHIAGLMTTFDEDTDSVAAHGVRRGLVESQAAAARLPLWPITLPHPCPNEVYEARMRPALRRARAEGITHVAFGDLYLEDIRDWRVGQLYGTGLEPLFPLWTHPDATPALARRMQAQGLRAVTVSIDPTRLAESFLGREFDGDFVAALPSGVDPCGERGEFHTFCFSGPMFDSTIPVRTGRPFARGGFSFVDLLPADAKPRSSRNTAGS